MPNPIPILKSSQFTLKMAGKTLISGLDFSIFPGDVIWIQGENGIGKTTLLKAIFHSFLKPPPEFEISLQNKRIPVSYLGHKPGLYPQWTLRMNLDYFKGLAEKSWGIPLSYLRYLDLFKMESRLDQKVSTFSQGTLQKAGLIRALFFEPQILLLDEPTSGLDPDSVQVWQKSMEVLPDNTSIVIVSHDFQKPPPQNKIWKLSKGGIQTSDIFIH